MCSRLLGRSPTRNPLHSDAPVHLPPGPARASIYQIQCDREYVRRVSGDVAPPASLRERGCRERRSAMKSNRNQLLAFMAIAAMLCAGAALGQTLRQQQTQNHSPFTFRGMTVKTLVSIDIPGVLPQ